MDATARALMQKRFGHDTILALATLDAGEPRVRSVDALYLDGSFYVVTHACSGKMRQIGLHPQVAVAGEWFTGQGIGESLGAFCDPRNAALAAALRSAFAAWLDNGHTDLNDPLTVILRIRMVNGLLFSHGQRYELDFQQEDVG